MVELKKEESQAAVQGRKDEFPLAGCCLHFIWNYARGGDVKIHAVSVDARTGNAPNPVETFCLSDLLPKGSVLPSPFPATTPSFDAKNFSGSIGPIATPLITGHRLRTFRGYRFSR